ncbi:hypothetical protein C8Q76DRAFT_37720 [Earliella scabrosa]|nr:hypothetical protein C8Q76DRAFT_37720 [Earliella scabrosa]
MEDFWDAIKPWLMTFGIVLYEFRHPEDMQPWERLPRVWYTPLVAGATPATLPYARCAQANTTKSRPCHMKLRLACARDESGRDLVLKLVDKESDQYRIYEEVSRNDACLRDPHTFSYVLPSTRILDTPHCYSIVVMPMWGNPTQLDDLCDVRQVLTFMNCLLEGLIFLHAKRIAHRDICEYNIVTNCYRLDQDREQLRTDLREHWKRDDVVWALMDYDQSIKHPENVSLNHYRRPADEAWAGAALYRPDDVCLGEPTYNPFAYDVAMLGNLFRVHFSEAVHAVPALAALYDRMTTHVYSQRFTAEEAGAFLKDATSHLSYDTLVRCLDLVPTFDAMVDSNIYWAKVPSNSVETWHLFRTPPTSIWSNILNWLISFPTCCAIIVPVRRLLQI